MCDVTYLERETYLIECAMDDDEHKYEAGPHIGVDEAGKPFIWYGKKSKREFTCGHLNYGDETHPATVFHNCSTCGQYYCDTCNYAQHRCSYCGDELDHVESYTECPDWITDQESAAREKAQQELHHDVDDGDYFV